MLLTTASANPEMLAKRFNTQWRSFENFKHITFIKLSTGSAVPETDFLSRQGTVNENDFSIHMADTSAVMRQ
jgi:hypothetical protein